MTTRTRAPAPAERGRRSRHRRRRWQPVALLAVGAVLGAAVGWWASTTISVGYVATASMVLSPVPGNAFSRAGAATLENLGTEAQVARSDAVLLRVLGPAATPAELALTRSRLTTSVVEGGEVIALHYRAGRADRASETTQALATATLRERSERAAAAKAAHVATIRALIKRTATDLNQADNARSRRILSERLAGLRSQLEQTRELPVDPGTVIGGSTADDSRLMLRMALIAVAAAGGAAAALLAWLALRRRRLNELTSW